MVASWVRTQWRARGYHFERAARASRRAPHELEHDRRGALDHQDRSLGVTWSYKAVRPGGFTGAVLLEQGLFCSMERMGYGFIRLFIGRRRSYGSTLPCELYHDRS